MNQKKLACVVVAGLLAAVGQARAQYTYTTIKYPGQPNGAYKTSLTLINGSTILGTYYNSDTNTTSAFSYNGSTFGSTPSVNDPNAIAGSTGVTAISGSDYAGRYLDSGGKSHGYIDVGGTYTTVDPASSTFTAIAGLSATYAVGYYNVQGNPSDVGFAYNRTTGVFTQLSFIPNAIAGDTAVGYSGANGISYNLDTASSSTITDSLGSSTVLTGISGSTIVGYYRTTLGTQSFVYNNNHFTALNVPGASATYGSSATGIYGNVVIGNYSPSNNYGLGYEVTVPEPASLGLLALGSMAALRRRRAASPR